MSFDFVQNLKSGIFWIGIFKMGGQLFTWLNTLIVARFLAPSDYGVVGMAALILSFLMLIGDFGFGSSIIQKKNLQEVHVHSLFWMTAGIALLFLVILSIIAPWVGIFFNEPLVTPILRLGSVALAFNILSDIPRKLLLKNLDYKSSGLVDFSSGLSSSILVLILAIKGFGAYSLIWGNIMMGFLRLVLACIRGAWYPKLVFQQEGLKGFFQFGGSIVLDRMIWYFYSSADSFIIAKRFSGHQLGLYSFAHNLSCVPIQKIQPVLHPVLFSSFAKLQDDLPQLRQQFLRIIKATFLFFSIIYCGLFWTIPDFIQLALGEKWVPMTLTLQILLIIQPLRSIANLSGSLLHALGRPGVGVVNTIIYTSVMIPGFLIGSFWGIEGVALAWLLLYPPACTIATYRVLAAAGILCRQYLKQLVDGAGIIIILSVTILGYHQIISYFDLHPYFIWIRFFSTVFIGIILTIVSLWFIDKELLTMLYALKKNRKLKASLKS